MTFERFSQGTSVLHTADARVKLIATLALTLVLALCQDHRTAGAGLCVAIVTSHFARLKFSAVFMRLLVVNSFTLFLWLTLPLTYPGTLLARIGPFALSLDGILLAALITLKTNAIIIFCIALLATSSIAEIGHSLGKLRFPTKLCMLLLFSYRYIFVIYQEFQRLNRAAKLRCFRPGTNMHTYKTYGYLFGMTLVKSWHRADRVNNAMLLRGFHGKFYSLHDQSPGITDITLGIAMLVTATTLGYIDFFVF